MVEEFLKFCSGFASPAHTQIGMPAQKSWIEESGYSELRVGVTQFVRNRCLENIDRSFRSCAIHLNGGANGRQPITVDHGIQREVSGEIVSQSLGTVRVSSARKSQSRQNLHISGRRFHQCQRGLPAGWF